MGAVPHTGSDINPLQREETIMMLLIDAFICMRVYKLDSSSCLSTSCNMCIFLLIYSSRYFKKNAIICRFWGGGICVLPQSQAVQSQIGNELHGLLDNPLILESDTES